MSQDSSIATTNELEQACVVGGDDSITGEEKDSTGREAGVQEIGDGDGVVLPRDVGAATNTSDPS